MTKRAIKFGVNEDAGKFAAYILTGVKRAGLREVLQQLIVCYSELLSITGDQAMFEQ